ncbi:Protein of unknown function [Gryllus bimaculatus]|nr:Protein of unknown function [Gryllus bimaculatus]
MPAAVAAAAAAMPPNPASPSAPPRADEKLLMVAEDFSEVPMKALLDEGAVPPPPPAAAAAEPVDEDRPKDRPVPWEIKWRNVVILSAMHLWTLYSLTYIPYIKWQTYLWSGFWTDPANPAMSEDQAWVLCSAIKIFITNELIFLAQAFLLEALGLALA